MIVNLSLGFEGTDPKTLTPLDAAIEAATALNIHFVVAAGNASHDAKETSPAHSRRVITVGAFDERLKLCDFSNTGKCVDILAPGDEILSTWTDNQYTVLSGTSM